MERRNNFFFFLFMRSIDLSIITVTYNSQAFIADCILSVQLQTRKITYEHIIVDNGSKDETLEYIRSNFGRKVQLIDVGKNIGFSKGNHIGMKHARGKYILFLNPDMKIERGYLDDLVEWMDKNTMVGLATCHLISHNKSSHPFLRPTRVPKLNTFFKVLIGYLPFSVSFNRDTIDSSFCDDKIQEIETARGAFFMLRRSLGISFDPMYFLLLEDLDLCNSIRSAGYTIHYFPKISCIDFYNRSIRLMNKPWYYLVGTRAIKTYVKKWHTPWHLIWISPLIFFGFLARIPFWGLRESLTGYANYKADIQSYINF